MSALTNRLIIFIINLSTSYIVLALSYTHDAVFLLPQYLRPNVHTHGLLFGLMLILFTMLRRHTGLIIGEKCDYFLKQDEHKHKLLNEQLHFVLAVILFIAGLACRTRNHQQGSRQADIGFLAGWFIFGRMLEVFGVVVNGWLDRSNWAIFGQVTQVLVVLMAAACGIGYDSFALLSS